MSSHSKFQFWWCSCCVQTLEYNWGLPATHKTPYWARDLPLQMDWPLHAIIFQTWNVFIHDCSWDDIGVVSHCLPQCSLCLRLGLRVVQLTRTRYFCQDPLINWRLPNIPNLHHCSPMQGDTKGMLCTGLPQYSPQAAVGRSCLTASQA